MSFFSNAQGLAIHDGSFTNISGDLYNIHLRRGEHEDQDARGKGLEILYQTAVVGAAHNAEQRFPPPNCYPGTRTQILGLLRNWVNDGTKTAHIYWFYGAAGVGKSAVAQTISEEFANSCLAASFFFSRADSARNHLQHFFTTIALQLVTSHVLGPLFREFIDLTICNNRNIIHANLEEQFRELIVKPCNQLTAEQWKELPRLIVIDGLDECLDIASQERLLSIICEAKSESTCEDESTCEAESSLMLPFEFLICSRPEPRLRNAFNHKDLRTMVARCELGDAFEPGKDIARYLCQELTSIRHAHGQTMAHAPRDWPGEGVVQLLVQRACGQFIYATTVLKFIGDYYGLPTERLEIILNIIVPEDYDSPYPDLDLLYLQILSACKQKELLLDVLAHLLRPGPDIFLHSDHPYQYERTSSQCIEGLYFLPKGKVGTLLFGLHSVLNIPDDDSDKITFRHASFVDFLSDKKRSGSYYVNKSQAARREQIAFYLLKRISYSLKNYRHPESMNSEFDVYAWGWWYLHCQRVGKSLSSRLLNALKVFDVTGYLNAVAKCRNNSLKAYASSVREGLHSLRSIAKWAQDTRRVSLYLGPEHLRELDVLAEQFSLFEQGFRIKIVPTLGRRDRESLMMAISVFKYDLCLFECNKRVVISALLNNQIKPAQVEAVSRSAQLCQQILSLEQIDSKSNLHSDTVTIKFAECSRHIGLQCLQVLRGPSESTEDVVDYARLEWINHLLLKLPHSSSEQIEIFGALMQNLCAIQTSEHARKAIAWVEDSVYAGQIKILQERLQELEGEEQKRLRPKEQRVENSEDVRSVSTWDEYSRRAGQNETLHKRGHRLEDTKDQKKLTPEKRWADNLIRRFKLRQRNLASLAVTPHTNGECI
ncbi:hypothetical protein GYMLUDRAFT_243130 [Collybiopsis luxurians FD-317 M1]|uniref:Nephrocystin 3-like N-terminal domain-containing protein n=1 Tax=Collybiopsis luxurians FD-317 M1 TaxID=944289 RepID=A0A0D0CZK5_9AGAR|nr:hypothetical protein GYMLUDRAFT_243130 [Collybiopsis luxurians FD-317 M1]